MKKNKRSLLWFSVLICIIVLTLSVTACDKSTKPKTHVSLGTISGTVTAPNKAPLDGVIVTIGTLTATTSSGGKYVISNVPVQTRALVNFSKPNYISTQKVANVIKNRTINTDAVLYLAATQTFSSYLANNIQDGGAEIQLPANAFVDAQGNAFNGSVYAETRYFDPTDPAALAAFPGEFRGIQTDGSETAFESYGFISASFYNASEPVEELQLGAGKTAHIIAPIPAALLANAPATIQMWYYDTETGKWKEQGVGTKNGNYYEGDVSHFTYWNFDHSIQVTDQATLTGTVVQDDSTHTAVWGAQVVATGVDYTGYTRAYSDAHGRFTLTVKASSQVKVQAFSGINSSNPTGVISTPASNGTTSIGAVTIADVSFTISGTVVNTAGVPITGGYGRIQQTNAPAGTLPFNSWLTINTNGHFSSAETLAGAGSTITVQINAMIDNSNLYSNPISFVIPNPGDSYDFGSVILRTGGKIKGRLMNSSNENLGIGYINFNQEGGSGAGEVYFNAMIDTLGYFILEGPPNTTVTNMVGRAQTNSGLWVTNAMTLRFPASGRITDLGNIIASHQTKRK